MRESNKEECVNATVANPYREREFAWLEQWSIGDHRLKVYGVSLPGSAARVRELLPQARARVEQVLPPAALKEGHSSGLGFVILHAGELGSWLLIDWWAHQDIVCQRMAMAPHGQSRFQSMADRPLHCCVWEQIVIHHERNAWVRHMMTRVPDAAAYLRSTLEDGLY